MHIKCTLRVLVLLRHIMLLVINSLGVGATHTYQRRGQKQLLENKRTSLTLGQCTPLIIMYYLLVSCVHYIY